MEKTELTRAIDAAFASAEACGFAVDDVVVLHDSNKVTMRLLPCGVVARVAPEGDRSAWFEVEVGRRLVEAGCPVAGPVAGARPGSRGERYVHERDGFVVTLWTYHAPVAPQEVAPGEYADALARLHAGMRQVDLSVPHFTDRVAQAQRLVADRERTPGLAEADRTLLGDTLRTLRRTIGGWGAPEQLLHGEPHPGNVLATADGVVFVDLETCCRGPVEFDLAHAPEEVGEQYAGADRELLRLCRVLVLAVVTTWRWDRDDRYPGGRELGVDWLAQLRTSWERDALGEV